MAGTGQPLIASCKSFSHPIFVLLCIASIIVSRVSYGRFWTSKFALYGQCKELLRILVHHYLNQGKSFEYFWPQYCSGLKECIEESINSIFHRLFLTYPQQYRNLPYL